MMQKKMISMLLVFALLLMPVTAFAQTHGFGAGQGRTDIPNNNDYFTDVWTRFFFNYLFHTGQDYREVFGNPTSTDIMPRNPDMDNIRRNKDAALMPPPFGMFSGEFPTDRSNIYITPDPQVYAWATSVLLNLPTYDTMGMGINGIQSGNNANGAGMGGGMLPSTSIMENGAGANGNTGDTTINLPPDPSGLPGQSNATLQPSAPVLPETTTLPTIVVPSGSISYIDMTQQWGQRTQVNPYADGSIGNLSIPKNNVSVKVFDGETMANLDKGVGAFFSTSQWHGNVAIAGHNSGSAGFFKDNNNLVNGDEIIYETQNGKRVYQVVSSRIIEYTDSSVLGWSNENILTLITCVAGSTTKRLVVVAIEKM
jgi:LPXTG-site transpeptidase (sortase) family protein